MEAWGRYCRPAVLRMMQAVGLDALYERAEGDLLWRRTPSGLVEVLDLVGGFGANLFGHYHPDLVAEERRLSERKVPLLAQGSCRGGAARLAMELAARIGDYVTVFTNSGTETVEAAMKHARLETGRGSFWAVRGAFHGKTVGSVQATWTYRHAYGGWGPKVRFIDPHDPADWAAAEAEPEAADLAGLLLEPVQGEGGVRPLPAPFVAWAVEACRRRGAPVIVDEIQSGMGRTGTLLASQALGIEPDYLCLSKALGGGLVKIGALMISRERLVDDFTLAHTSTFAEDDRGCLLAAKALHILDRDDLPARCAASGKALQERLQGVADRFPDVIQEVRGAGLMVGVQLREQDDSPSNTLRMLSRQEVLGYAAAAYLLNVQRVRVLPTLSQPLTLRVQPSAYVSEVHMDRAAAAIEALCTTLRAADLVHFTGFAVGRPAAPVQPWRPAVPLRREAPRITRRVAFLGHLIVPEHAVLWDGALERFTPDEIDAHVRRSAKVLGPVIFDQEHITSVTGEQVHFSFIGLYLTSAQVSESLARRDGDWIMEKIEEGVALARDSGCQVVGLGGYTSIVARNCKRVRTPGIALTSGNSLTVGMGLEALRRAADEAGIGVATSALGVVGAGGNIASTYAAIMAPRVREVVLVVRDPESPRARAQVDALRQIAPRTRITATADLGALRACRLVLAASNAAEPLIFPHHLYEGPTVICDISLPPDVDASVAAERPDVRVIRGGVVRLPHNPTFGLAGAPLDPGLVYACLAETVLMGLEGATTHGSYGPVTPAGVEAALAMARKHGFELGAFQQARAY
ncbi:MAG: aminotransferase class III-fold pyridoxal phosphate-dependent enzyme [Longimicrobiaceae bacterium]